MRDHPVFICGHPKSGTSLLRSLLDGHSRIIVYPEESVFFRRYFPKARNGSLQTQLELAEKHLIHIFAWNQDAPPTSQEGFPDRDYSHISFEDVKSALHRLVRENAPRHPGDLLAAAVIAYGQVSDRLSPQTRYWLEKSPYTERYAAQIFAWWPKARCIHIVRDPRDNYASYRRKHPDWSPILFANSWERSTHLAFRNYRRYGSERYWILRYEDLVQAPGNSLDLLCEYLAIEFEPSMLVPTRGGQDWLGNSMFPEKFEGIDSSPIGRWEENLTRREASLLELLTRPLLDELRYEYSKNWPLSSRVEAITWDMRRRLRKIFPG